MTTPQQRQQQNRGRLFAQVGFVASAMVIVGVAVGLWGGSPSAEGRADLSGTEVVRSDVPSADVAAGTVSSTSKPLLGTPTPATTISSGTPTTAPNVEVVRPGVPVRLTIDALGLSAPVSAVGLEPDGSMEIPTGVEAGWYHYGARPGDPTGSAVLAGHIDHQRKPGVFFELRRLGLGEVVVVTDRAGAQRRFVVSERFQVEKSALPVEELFRTTGDPVLTLISCGGEFDRKARRYNDNIVIRATPI